MLDNNDFENDEMTPLEGSFAIEKEPITDNQEDRDFAHNRSAHEQTNRNKNSIPPRTRPGMGPAKTGSMSGSNALNNALNKNRGPVMGPGNSGNVGGKANQEEAKDEEENNEENGNNKQDPSKQAADKAVDAALDKLEKMGPKGKIAAKAIKKTGAKEKIGQLVDKAIKKIKKRRIKLLMKIIAPLVPYIVTFLAILLIISTVMSQIMLVMEGLDKALVTVSTGVEKIVNFMSGEGWVTNEEEFYKTLNDEYQESLKYSPKGIDIPLLAATINYSKLTDISVYEKDVAQSDPPIDSDSDNTEGLFSNFIEAEQIRNFYAVGKDKLGTLYNFIPGNRKLIGHMVDISFEFGTYDFNTAFDNWGTFFEYLSGVVDDNLIDTVKSLVNPIEMIDNIKTKLKYDDVNDGNSDNFLEYDIRNRNYEMKELFDAIFSVFNDDVKATDVEYDDQGEVNTSTGFWPAPRIIMKIDEQKYYDYLVNVYIPGTFFSDGEYNESQAIDIADEIFAQRDSYRYLLDEDPGSEFALGNNVKVNMTTCGKTNMTESLSLYDYLKGVLYMEGGLSNPVEYLKAQAIAAKTYLYALNNVSVDGNPSMLRIANCQQNQTYCSVELGCHYVDDGDVPGEYDSHDTLYSGPDSNGIYLREPLTDVSKKQLVQEIVDSTLSQFYVYNDAFVLTQYRSECTELTCDPTTNIIDQKKAIQMASNGSSYTEILSAFYTGEIKEINIFGGYPLDYQYTYITSRFGWRKHPIKHCCKFHEGYDFDVPADQPIYSVADGVVVDSVISFATTGYGNYVTVGHGALVNGAYEYYTRYAHMISAPPVSKGETVQAGQIIGRVGSTGGSTGPHLHFEYFVMQNSGRVKKDPSEILKGAQLQFDQNSSYFVSEQQCINAGVPKC